jgi:hypothetical protein
MPRAKRQQETTDATDRGSGAESRRRSRLLQADVPAYTLEEALRVPEALRDQYGKQPTRPLMVGKALDLSPAGPTFRMLTGAAMAYGVTDGAAQADTIAITDLGKRIVAPTVEGDDVAAKREAVLRPRVIREFLTKYDGNKLPNKSIALNVLEELGVPDDATGRAFDMIIKNAEKVGFFEEINGSQYVSLDGASKPTVDIPVAAPGTGAPAARGDEDAYEAGVGAAPPPPLTPAAEVIPDLTTNKRVFVTHGSNREIVNQLKEVLTFGKFEPVVSVETEATAKSVPDKVLDEMRSCGAGIVHVGAEQTLMDNAGKEHKVLNPNVLIEIGAALALYKRNFILLVERGTTLPSNLQGLYEVRYEGEKLDYEATMKLLRAFNQFQVGG